jgi:uncharacterized membrane protein HdeD (DUF308 family)
VTEQSKPSRPNLYHPLFGRLGISWGWLLALGLLSLILGSIGLGMEVLMTIASVQLFGVLLLVGGVVQLLNAFQCKGWKGMLGQVAIALLYIAAGVVCIADPLGASGVLTLAIAGILMGIGAMRLVMAIQHRGHPGWGWVLLAGALAVALGVMVLLGWPESSLWVIGLFVSIELIFNGWSLVFLALAARAAAREGGDKGEDPQGSA